MDSKHAEISNLMIRPKLLKYTKGQVLVALKLLGISTAFVFTLISYIFILRTSVIYGAIIGCIFVVLCLISVSYYIAFETQYVSRSKTENSFMPAKTIGLFWDAVISFRKDLQAEADASIESLCQIISPEGVTRIPSLGEIDQKFVVDAWEQFSNEDICWLSEIGKEEKLSSGEYLIDEDNVNDFFYIILHGTLDVFIQGQKGRRVARCSRGEMIGEIAFLCGKPKPSATVIVQEDCNVLSIDFNILRDKLDQDQAFALRFYKVLAIKNACRTKETTDLLRNEPARILVENPNLIKLESYFSEHAS